MRLISQCGKIDVPYEYGSLSIGVGKCEDTQHAVIKYRNISSPNGTTLARYTTEAKAIKAMEMMRNAYLGSDYGYNTEKCILYHSRDEYETKVFKFPADDEIEV